MSITAANPNIIRIFTTNVPLAYILHHLGVKLDGDRCCATIASGHRCSRKNCRTTFMCSQHQKIWWRDFSFDLFYSLHEWEMSHYNWYCESDEGQRALRAIYLHETNAEIARLKLEIQGCKASRASSEA